MDSMKDRPRVLGVDTNGGSTGDRCVQLKRSARRTETARRVGGAILLCLMTACGTDGETVIQPASSRADLAGEDSQSSQDPQVDAGNGVARYAVTSRVFAPDFSGQTSFLWLAESLEQGALEVSDGIELPGGASIWGAPQTGHVYVVSTEDLSVTRYTLTGNALERGERIGLGGQGISALLGERLVVDGTERGYLFDMGTAQILELDLSELAIVRSIDLSAALIESAELNFLTDTGFRRLGERLVASVYGVSANYDRVARESKLLSFDPSTGSLELKEMPCGGLNYSVTGPGGDIYFATDPYVASVHLLDPESAPAPCMVRLSAASGDFSMTRVALDELTGAPTGGLVPGSEGFAYVRAIDGALYAPSPGATYLEAFSAPVWRRWRISLADSPTAELVERPPLAGGIRMFEVDGAAYENESSADFATTRLVKTTVESPASGLTMPGATWGIVRLR